MHVQLAPARGEAASTSRKQMRPLPEDTGELLHDVSVHRSIAARAAQHWAPAAAAPPSPGALLDLQQRLQQLLPEVQVCPMTLYCLHCLQVARLRDMLRACVAERLHQMGSRDSNACVQVPLTLWELCREVEALHDRNQSTPAAARASPVVQAWLFPAQFSPLRSSRGTPR